MHTLALISNTLAMICAGAAAWLWHKSTTVRVAVDQGNMGGPEIIVDDCAFIATARQQTMWSRRAATAAALAAFFQALGLAVSIAAT